MALFSLSLDSGPSRPTVCSLAVDPFTYRHFCEDLIAPGGRFGGGQDRGVQSSTAAEEQSVIMSAKTGLCQRGRSGDNISRDVTDVTNT